MSDEDDEAEWELQMACRARDSEKVSQLFALHPLGADKATAALKDVGMDHEIMRILLDNGADPSVVRIHRAAHSGQSGEILRLLDLYGYNFESDGHLILQDFAHDRETLDWLLDRGANINLTDYQRLDDGFNLYIGGRDDSLHLLNIVAANGDIDLFDHLVSRGADPSKSTALHSASRCQDPVVSRAMVCHLLDKHKMDINVNNEDFRDFFHDAPDTGTPLCIAIFHRNLAVVHELLERGARITDRRTNPIHFAIGKDGFLPALEPLLRAGADHSVALSVAVGCMDFNAVELCLKFGADPAPALQEAIEDEGKRQERVAEDAAYYKERGEKKSKLEFKQERLAERNHDVMIGMLQYAMGSATINYTTGRQ